jgi:hypothetical protein
MCLYFSELTESQQATVKAIFEDQPRSDIPWRSVLDLFNGMNGLVNISARRICVVFRCEGECGGEPRVGIIPCSNERGYVGSHLIEDLRDLLSGVGVEPQ